MQEDIYEKIERLVRQHPDKAIELFEDWADKMPEEANEGIDNKLYGSSIRTKEKMDEAIRLAERYTNKNKSWRYDTFKQVLEEMKLSIQDKKYSCYDINFVATLKYLIHCNTLNPLNATAKTYIKMALDELNLDNEYAYKHYEELYKKYN
ncbi:MAG: hypothetical protein ACI4S3_07385 [Candidatus Gastranaerophilaceae bacterium]